MIDHYLTMTELNTLDQAFVKEIIQSMLITLQGGHSSLRINQLRQWFDFWSSGFKKFFNLLELFLRLFAGQVGLFQIWNPVPPEQGRT